MSPKILIKLPLLSAALVLLTAPLQAQLSGTDNFNDNSKDTAKWGADAFGGGAILVEANARLEYRVATPQTLADTDEATRPWILNTAGNSDGFDVILDVFNNATPSGDNSASIGLTITSLQSAGDSISMDLNRSGPSGDGSGFLAILRSNAASGEVLPYTVPTSHPSVTTGSVRLSYNPTTKIFTAYYDPDGSGNGAQWEVYGSFGVGASGGGSMRNSPWQLASNMGFQVSVSGSSEGLIVASGAIHADNFSGTSTVSAPTVTTVSPASGPTTGGTSVTITGTNFTGATGVTIGGTAATGITVVNATTITATTPVGTAGAKSVVVTTPGGSNSANPLFTYVAAPTVTAIAPNTGTTTGGTSVTITGTNFTSATGVTIGGTAATGITVVNATTITATTPAGTAGAKSVVVTTPGGSNGANSLFTYVAPAPTVTGISPNTGTTAGGTSVTITGTNLTGATGVTIGGTAATGVTVVNATTITASTPAGTTGAKSVVITTPGGSNSANSLFTYVAPAPTVTAISPTSGPAAGGTSVTITGTNLIGATGVTIGGTAATGMTVVNATTITATTPAGAAGAKSVVVTTPGGSNSTNSLFTYVAAPTLTAISPTSGPTAGGTSVTITGTNLTGATSVTIGGTAATGMTVVNATTITATTPAGTAGAKSVVVTTLGGSNSANSLFTYVAAPTVTAMTASGITSTGATLNGTVNPNGFTTTAQFEYGLTASYGSIASVTLSPNNGAIAQNVSGALSGLQPGTLYYYRLSATNSGGTSTTSGATFTTQGGQQGQDYAWVNFAGMPGGSGSADGASSTARFSSPFGVAVDGGGNVYVADTSNHTIRKISSGGVVTTLAGSAGLVGSADGTGSAARFRSPRGVAVDGSGNVYVADTSNHTIRKISSGGVVTTLAGSAGNPGSTNGTGSAARFDNPTSVAVDGVGNVYAVNGNTHTIRKITSGGVVTTLAGSAGLAGSADGTGSAARFYYPTGVAVDGSGNIYVTDSGNHTIRRITSSGVVTTLAGSAGTAGSADGTGSAARFRSPRGVAVDGSGNVYVAESENHTIRKITSGGVVTTLAGSAGEFGSNDGTGSAARFYFPYGVTVDGGGNVYVAANHTIRKISSGGTVTTLAGSADNAGSADGTGSAARFYLPYGVAVDGSGNVYVGDYGNHTIRKITPGGMVTTLAGSAGNSGSADGTGSAARFNYPWGVAVDGSGNVYVADGGNHTIRKITSGGVVTTLAGSAGSSGSGSGDGTGSAARFNYPRGVAVDGSGNVYVADMLKSTIRKISSGGVVTTLAGSADSYGSVDGTGSAARFSGPYGVAVDGGGNVFVADSGNHTIRKITSGGVVTTLAGSAGELGNADGTGSAARFYYPYGVAVDGGGSVYVADNNNKTIRRISSGGVVTTIGGSAGVIGGADGLGVAATFAHPSAVAVGGNGRIFVADSNNNRISTGMILTPVVTLASPSGLTATTVTLNGSVNPNGLTTTAQFEYGLTASYDSTASVMISPSNGTTAQNVSAVLSGLLPGTLYHFRLSATNAGGTSNTSYSTFTTYVAAPTVTSISPTTGSTAGGTSVTITGTNLSGATGVTFGGVAATSLSTNTATSITCVTPAGTAGAKSVVVTTPGGSNSVNSLFTYVAAPTVASISPTSGPATGGISVTIVGTNFTGATGVTIGGTAATGITVVNATTITATTPAGTAGTASVVVTTPGGSNSANSLFTYVAAPTVTSISPVNHRLAGGTFMQIFGTNFSGATSVTIGGTAATSVSVVNSTSITCVTPAGTAGSKSVVVTTPGGSNSANSLFTYVAAPTVASIAPASGPTAGGTIVIITGTNFTGVFGVTIGGAAATSIVVSNATTINAIAPAGTAGTASVVVTTPGGSNSANSLFTYVAAPTVTAIARNTGTTAGGTSVTITGTGFTGATAVTIGGAAATGMSLVNATTITATTPAGTAGAKSVVVTTPGGSNSANSLFTYVAAPTVTAMTASGITSTWATLNGTVNPNGFTTTAQFEYGLSTSYGSTASVTLAPSNGTTVQSVSGALSGLQPGTLYYYRLSATNSGGTSTTSGGTFTTQSEGQGQDYAWVNFAGMPGESGSVDGTGSAARCYYPFGVAVDGGGDVYVADTLNHTIRKTTSSGVMTTLAGRAGFSGSTDGTGSDARFNDPKGVAVDDGGNIYVADTNNRTIRKITPAGVVTTLAGSAGSSGSADGTGSAARFNAPTGVAVDGSGNVYVGDYGNHTIRKINPAGVVTTLAGSAGSSGSADGTGSAARFFIPAGVAVDGAGNVYVADTANQTIRKITPAGMVTTLAGSAGSSGNTDGTGSGARFAWPYGVAVDGGNSVYVAGGSHTIRKITPGGVVTTIGGRAGFSGSTDGTSSDARFGDPKGVAVNGIGKVYVADTENNRISVGSLGAPTTTLVNPSSGSTQGGTNVTITGTGFIGVTGVTFGGGAATNVAVVNATTLTATTPAGSAGPASVRVTTPMGNSAANELYTYLSPPTVTLTSLTALTTASVMLNGTVNANALPTTARFEYGLTTSYGTTASVTLSPTNGITAQNVNANITGLTSGTLYHYRLSAINSSGTAVTTGDSFTTLTASQAVISALAAAGLSGPNAALDAAPHNDGVENLLKYAFNMDLSGPDSATMSAGGGSGLPGISSQPNGAASTFRFEFVRRIGSGLIYTPQKSNDLTLLNSWVPLADTPTVVPLDATWERVIYEEPYNAATTPRCFGRIQVVLPP